MYDVIETPTDPNDLALDDRGDERQARKEWEDDVEAVYDAVRAYTEVVTDVDDDFHVRAVVPFRITAYRFDLLEDKIEDMDLRVPAKDTDGWRDLSKHDSTAYRTFQFHHRDVRGVEWQEAAKVEDAREMVRNQVVESLCERVLQALIDGEVDQTIDGTRYEEVAVDAPGAALVDVDEGHLAHPSSPDDLYEEREVTYPAGTAKYRVDAIVSPESWEDEV